MRRLFRAAWETLESRWPAIALALVSGVLYFVGYCGYDQLYLTWICLVPILWVLDDKSLSIKQALFFAWLFGTVTHMGGYTWIIGMLRDFAYLPLPLALLGYLLLCLGQGSLLAVWGLVVNRLLRRDWPVVWVAPVVMVIAEWLYPALFPSYLSNSQYRWITFIQSLDIWGPLGLTFILVLSSSVIYATLAWKLRDHGRAPVAGWVVLALFVGGDLLYGVGASANIDDTVAHAPRRIKVGMVQTNMGIYAKTANPKEGLRRHREQSLELERQGAELIVWPESGYYYPIYEGSTNVKRRVMGPFRRQ